MYRHRTISIEHAQIQNSKQRTHTDREQLAKKTHRKPEKKQRTHIDKTKNTERSIRPIIRDQQLVPIGSMLHCAIKIVSRIHFKTVQNPYLKGQQHEIFELCSFHESTGLGI